MTFANIGDLASSEKLSVEGRPVDLGAGRVVWVRRAGGHNQAWELEVAVLVDENRDAIENTDAGIDVPRALQMHIEREAMIRVGVARWEGFMDADGSPVPCNPDTVRELFDLAPDVYARCVAAARDSEGYRLDADIKSA